MNVLCFPQGVLTEACSLAGKRRARTGKTEVVAVSEGIEEVQAGIKACEEQQNGTEGQR